MSDEARRASQMWHLDTLKLVVRDCPRQPDFPIADADIAWIARHLTRTKLGVALGAGGAKGYAHVGVLQVLEETGYASTSPRGSSVGGFVAALLALGNDAASIDAQFRAASIEETVAKLFAGPVVGAAGLEVFCRDAARGDRRATVLRHGHPAVDPDRRPDGARAGDAALRGAARGAAGGDVGRRRVPDGRSATAIG